MKKLFTFLAIIAITSFFSVKADWVKNVTLANHDFTVGTTVPFTTANSLITGNNVGAPYITAGMPFLRVGASGSGGRGTKITNMTDATPRTDTIFYEFDWNPYMIIGQANSSGTSGIEPASYAACVVRGSNDSIVFGLWFDRWSLKAGSKYNTDSLSKEPLGDLHLMNLSTDEFNPVPAKIVTRTVNAVETSYYTNTLIPFSMYDPKYTSNYAVICDSMNKSTDLGRTFKMSRWYHIKAQIDFTNKNIISFEISENGVVAENKKSFTNLSFVNKGAANVSYLEIAGTRGKTEGATTNGANTNYEQRFDNIDIYTIRQVAQAASVTIRYKDEAGNEIKAARTVTNLEVGTVFTAIVADKVNIVYNEEYYLFDVTTSDNVTVQSGGSDLVLHFKKATPKNTVVQISAPATSELYKDVTIGLSVKTPQSDIVSSGDVLLFVNNVVKNRVTLDVLGKGSVSMPNLLVGDENISAVYIGDHINYSNSDTARIVISITPSVASVKPYPVYFDLCDQPEIIAWDRERGVTTATPRAYTHYFRMDSLPGIMVTDTINLTHKVGYYLAGSTYDKIDNAYNRADFVIVPLGSGRPTWVKFKTPWLNAGSYNVYISHRVSGDPKTNMGSITMDNKELYFPNEEMYGRWFKSWAGVNNRRQWNAKAHSGSMGMNYIGSVSIDNSGTHSLKINVLPENGASYNLDMLQFIPVDMDSLNINLPAATSMAKVYYPMFDWVGFARQPGYDAATVPTTYADFTQFAIPYQVTDMTDWGMKYSHSIDSVGLIKKLIGGEEYVANYVTVYRAEDKWTRVAEGFSNDAFIFTCELPKGDYYYETINFTDLGDGAQDYRTFINSGYFSLGANAVDNHQVSNIKAYAYNRTLTVKGIKSGASISVVDLTGRTLINAISKSDVFTTALPQGVYLVKVVSGEILRTKVIVR
ncbi:MAG TPA: DUF6383 domain-containing protein [Paludibacter sp.]|nr:DUF6383 domain-containing protein [Paludibacter sp.]